MSLHATSHEQRSPENVFVESCQGTNHYEQGNHSKNATLVLNTVKHQIFLMYNLLILKL